MPLIFLVVSALVGLFTLTSFATFKEVRKRKQKKIPKFMKQWNKIKERLEK